MSERPPCQVDPLTAPQALWLRGLLRYTRNITMAHPLQGSLPNMSPLFCALTFGYQNRLQLLTLSYKSTQHGGYILSDNGARAPYDPNTRLVNGVVLSLMNSNSPEIGLRLYGEARLVPSAELPEATIAYNAVRTLKGLPERWPGPKNEEDPGEALFAVAITHADTQGECRTKRRNPVDEGHPAVDLDVLRGFETMPPLANPPNTMATLHAGLEATGYT